MGVKAIYVTVRIPVYMVKRIDELIKQGIFLNRSDFVRYAIQVVIESFDRR